MGVERRNATQRDDQARQRLQAELERLREQSLAALVPATTRLKVNRNTAAN